MPIKVPNNLPAVKTLNEENIFVMQELRAATQDIRPLHILIVNLMPTKIATETQLARLIGNTPLQVEMELLHTETHISKHISVEHLHSFYHTFAEIREKKYDGMIITGAPVETLPFEEVEYWSELCDIMEWSKTHVHSTVHICWGAQAGLYYHYGVEKKQLPMKLSGIYRHRVEYKNPILLRGFDDEFMAPHSRYTCFERAELEEKAPGIKILASSEEAGVYVAMSEGGKQIFITGHCEYDADTLKKEYLRDVDKGIDPAIPANYFPNDDPTKEPVNTWRSHANLLYSNWLNYFVYQTTPYDLAQIR